MSVILVGPQGSGKTRNAVAIARALGLANIIDGWVPGRPIPADTLVIGNELPDGVEVFQGHRVMRISAALALVGKRP